MAYRTNGHGYRIILRNDTEEHWQNVNPVLREDELVVSKFGSKLIYKLGNGIDHYSDLPNVSLREGLQNGYIYVDGIKCVKICLTKDNTTGDKDHG